MSDNLNKVEEEQDLRDIFNKYGLNYSHIVGDDNMVVSCSLFVFNKALKEITTLINNEKIEAYKKGYIDGGIGVNDGYNLS